MLFHDNLWRNRIITIKNESIRLDTWRYSMRVNNMSGKLVRFFFALLIGIFVAAFAPTVSTVQASSNTVVIEEEQAATADVAEDNAGSGVLLLLGGMLLIIIAVVITVVASVVVTAPIADEV